MPQGALSIPYELPAPKPVIAIVLFFGIGLVYGGIGFLGLQLSNKLGFSDIWDPDVTNNQRFVQPAIIGTGIGIFFIISDTALSHFNLAGHIPHPPFPSSLIASVVAAIGEEIIFRLFFISFWLWLISRILFKGKWKNLLFWIITGFSALAFSLGHLPSVMFLFNYTSLAKIPMFLLFEIVLLNGVLSFFAAYYFRKYGFVAAVSIHFWTDFAWHVIFGLIQ